MKVISFNKLSKKLINTKKYKTLKNEYHHGITRYEHSLRVAKNTYKVTKFLKLNYVDATIGALLHDYFNEYEYLDKKGLDKPRIHPFISLNNAILKYDLSEISQNIIISHMFPIGGIKPIYMESWIVTIIDKIVASYEYIRYKFNDKLKLGYIFIKNYSYSKLSFA